MDRPGISAVGRRIVAAAVTGARVAGPVEISAVLFLVPGVLVGTHFLPGSEAWAFSLASEGVLTSRWTLWTAFASSYVHADAGHLLHNVAVYWMIVGVVYPLSVIAGWRTRFFGVVIACLFVVPVVSAWVTLATLGTVTDVPSVGFSDVNTGLLGFLLVVWFVAADRVTTGRVPRQLAFVAAPASIAIVLAAPSTVWYFPQYPILAAAAAGMSFLLAAWLRWHGTRKSSRNQGRPDSRLSRGRPADGSAPIRAIRIDPVREFALVVGASVAVSGIVGSMLLVPAGANVWAHFAGYLVGLTAALPLVVLDA